MEFDYHRAALLMFAIGIFGCLAGMFLLAFRKHSPERKKNSEELQVKNERLKNELHENLIQQTHSLNKMLSSGKISEVNYDIKRAEILNTLKKYDIDDSIVKSIPRAQYKDNKELQHRRMYLSTTLNERGELTDDELNDNINKSLDDLK